MGALPPEILILIVAVASAFAGGLLTWVIVAIGSDGKDAQKPLASAQERAEAPSSDDVQELLRVSRTEDGLGILVRGRRYRHLRDIVDSQVGRETVEAVRAVLAFAEGQLPSVQQQQVSSPGASKQAAADTAAYVERPRRPSPLVSGPTPELDPSKPLLLVEEINRLVQERLQERPDLAEHDVRLVTSVDGDLLIYVDQESFHSADDIPDPEVRAFIQDAIREWETR